MSFYAIRHLFVDRDGTLVDTCRANVAAYAVAFADVNLFFGEKERAAIRSGERWTSFIPDSVKGDSQRLTQLRAVKEAYFVGALDQMAINQVILGLAERHEGPHALVTTASRASTEVILDAFGLTDMFPVVVTGDDVEVPKPSPECYLLALHMTGAMTEHALAVEDSPIGIEAAHRAGLRVKALDHFCADPECSGPAG